MRELREFYNKNAPIDAKHDALHNLGNQNTYNHGSTSWRKYEEAYAKHVKHPVQPLVYDAHGVQRFKANKIVQHLLDKGGIDLNQIAAADFSESDRQQFAQLIGYSLSGYGELSYVTDEAYQAAMKQLMK